MEAANSLKNLSMPARQHGFIFQKTFILVYCCQSATQTAWNYSQECDFHADTFTLCEISSW